MALTSETKWDAVTRCHDCARPLVYNRGDVKYRSDGIFYKYYISCRCGKSVGVPVALERGGQLVVRPDDAQLRRVFAIDVGDFITSAVMTIAHECRQAGVLYRIGGEGYKASSEIELTILGNASEQALMGAIFTRWYQEYNWNVRLAS